MQIIVTVKKNVLSINESFFSSNSDFVEMIS